MQLQQAANQAKHLTHPPKSLPRIGTHAEDEADAMKTKPRTENPDAAKGAPWVRAQAKEESATNTKPRENKAQAQH